VPLFAISGHSAAPRSRTLCAVEDRSPAVLLTGIAWFATWPGAARVSGTLGEWLGPMNRALALWPGRRRFVGGGGRLRRGPGARFAGGADLCQSRGVAPTAGRPLGSRGGSRAGDRTRPRRSRRLHRARRGRSRARRSGRTLALRSGAGARSKLRAGSARPRTTRLRLGRAPEAGAIWKRHSGAGLGGSTALGVALALKATGSSWMHLERAVAIAPPGRSINSIAGWRSRSRPGSRGRPFQRAPALDPAYHRARPGSLSSIGTGRPRRARAGGHGAAPRARRPRCAGTRGRARARALTRLGSNANV
jgi:hypothetical protein